MTTRTLLTIASACAALFASASFASTTAVPETPGLAGPQAVAESIHMARVHGGLHPVGQQMAQAPGLASTKAAAEAIHLPKQHGSINDSADQRMLREGARY